VCHRASEYAHNVFSLRGTLLATEKIWKNAKTNW